MSAAPDPTTGELVDADVRQVSVPDHALLNAISKAELDQAITTARAYPRSVKTFIDECMQLATLNEQIADDCIYAVPRREDGQTKMIEGPSARLAEIVLHAWGNCRAGARVVEEGREFVRSQGIFHDLQKNVHITFEVTRRITTRSGKRYSADMISTTGNAASSIALRNAVFKGIPKALWWSVYEAARKVVAGDSKTLVNRRSDALAYLQKLGATQDKVLATLGVKGVEDITLEHLTQLRGLANSIKEGELTVEQAFAPAPEQAQASRAEQAKEALAKKPSSDPYEPHYTVEKAIAQLKEPKTIATLEEIWKGVQEDLKRTNREIPNEVHAAYTDHKATLEQKL